MTMLSILGGIRMLLLPLGFPLNLKGKSKETGQT